MVPLKFRFRYRRLVHQLEICQCPGTIPMKYGDLGINKHLNQRSDRAGDQSLSISTTSNSTMASTSSTAIFFFF